MRFGKITKPQFTRLDQRGSFHELSNRYKWESLIYGTMQPGAEMGHHYHHHTVLFFYLIKGSAKVKTYNLKTSKICTILLKSLQGYIFRPEEVRVITYLEPSEFIIMKSHSYDPNNPDLIEYKEGF